MLLAGIVRRELLILITAEQLLCICGDAFKVRRKKNSVLRQPVLKNVVMSFAVNLGS